MEDLRNAALEIAAVGQQNLVKFERLDNYLVEIRNETRLARETLTRMDLARNGGITPSIRTMLHSMDNSLKNVCERLRSSLGP